MIDLHTHSTASDGTLSPEALVELAAKRGVSTLALTDHDTVAGVAPAQARGAALGVEVIAGVEVSVRSLAGAMHILGYFLRLGDPELERRLDRWCADRRERASRIVLRLNELGFALSYASVEAHASRHAIGRPHVARALVEAGVVGSPAEAFERYLRRGRPAFVPREMPEPAEAIAVAKAAGGVAVLAHPGTLGLKGRELRQCIEELKAFGLEGLEVNWSGHSASQRTAYAGLARELGLLITGGSDFHGDNKPEIQLGSGRRGNVKVSLSVLAALRRAAGRS